MTARQRTHDVYGFGHALVDLQFSLDVAALHDLGIEKGVMTMIDEARQQELVLSLPEPVKSASGGSAANTMIAIARFGGHPHYACLVGDDEWGEFYRRDLEQAGVGAAAANAVAGRTGQCVVIVTPDADRTMATFLGVSASISSAQLQPAILRDSQFIYLEGYLVTSDAALEACVSAQQQARKHGTSVSLTLSDPAIVAAFMDQFEALIESGVDLLFCNEDEARALTGAVDRAAACRAIANLVPRACITCGSDGAVVIDGDTLSDIGGVSVEAVDTTGAGDAFAGGVLFGMTHGLGLAKSAKLGCHAGSRVVSAYGPRLEEGLSDMVDEIISAT